MTIESKRFELACIVIFGLAVLGIFLSCKIQNVFNGLSLVLTLLALLALVSIPVKKSYEQEQKEETDELDELGEEA